MVRKIPLMKNPKNFTLAEIEVILKVENIYGYRDTVNDLIQMLQEREKLLLTYQVQKEAEKIKQSKIASIPKKKPIDYDVPCEIVGTL